MLISWVSPLLRRICVQMGRRDCVPPPHQLLLGGWGWGWGRAGAETQHTGAPALTPADTTWWLRGSGTGPGPRGVPPVLHDTERSIQCYNDDGLSPIIITVKVWRNFCTIITIICWVPNMCQIHTTYKSCCSHKLSLSLTPWGISILILQMRKMGLREVKQLAQDHMPMHDMFHPWTNSKVCAFPPLCYTAPPYAYELQELILSLKEDSSSSV